ncbi:MAG: hypothetical protein SGJ20_09995 [Planctomycetota bacterium]|nr:hypothetical protein [Planctomycetota bacterium]
MKTIGKAIYEFHSLTSGSKEVAHKHEQVSAKALGLRESWFRDAIFREPELVIAPCRAGGLVEETEIWMPWYKEYPLAKTGRVDVMLISSSGRIGIVETKLSYNPEGRREVVAQVFDYSLALQEIDPLNFEGTFPWEKASPNFYDDFAEKLVNGEFLLIIAGDELDPRASRLGEGLLRRHLTSSWNLAMIDLNLYQSIASPESVFIVPALCSAVTAEKRQVIRVIVEDRKGATVGATVIPGRSSPAVASARASDIESDADFVALVRAQYPEQANAVEKVLAKFHEIAAADPDEFECGRGSASANLYWKQAGRKLRIFGLYRAANLRIWLDYLNKNGYESTANEIRILAAPVLGVSNSEFGTSAAIFVDDKNVNTLITLVSDIVSSIKTVSVGKQPGTDQ